MPTEPAPPTSQLLCTALWDAHVGPSYTSDQIEQFWARDLELCRSHCAPIFTPVAAGENVNAFLHLIEGITRGKGRELAGDDSYTPRSWFHLWHSYYQRGLITPELWGTAARVLYVASPPGPGEVLSGLCDAMPWHLMCEADYQRWLRLPALSTVYRGICAADVEGAWRGVSWTTDPDYAATYARARTTERYDVGDFAGWPRLMEATIPRGAILAVIRDANEVLVDHRRLSDGMVRELSPLKPDEAAKTIDRLKVEASTSRHLRAAMGMAGYLDA